MLPRNRQPGICHGIDTPQKSSLHKNSLHKNFFMSNQKPSSESTTLIRAVTFVVILVLSVCTVIYLKRSSDVPLTPEGIAARDSLRHIVHPDTTATPETQPVTPTAGYPAEPDSMTMDLRVPSDAGYEDGYYAGITDGVAGQERASYDESSQFPKASQRRNYAEAYRRGYAQGYADGLEGKEFGVTPADPEDEELLEEEEEYEETVSEN